MAINYTEAGTGAAVTISTLQTLADDTAGLSAAYSNDASAERQTLSNFLIQVGTQGGVRDASAQVSLLIVPEVNALYGDTATLLTAGNYIARYADGTAVTFLLDAATTARDLTAAGVQIPNGNYKIGVLNETNQDFAGVNVVYKTGDYTIDDVA